MYLWSSDHVESLIKQNRKIILPIIFPALEKVCRTHWNQAVQTMTQNVRKIFSDADPDLFEECVQKFMVDEVKEKERKENQEALWRRLEQIIISESKTTEMPLAPQTIATQTNVT